MDQEKRGDSLTIKRVNYHQDKGEASRESKKPLGFNSDELSEIHISSSLGSTSDIHVFITPRVIHSSYNRNDCVDELWACPASTYDI